MGWSFDWYYNIYLFSDSFAVEDKKIVYELQNAGEEQDQGKGKKGDKKPAKKESKKEEDQ